MAKEKYIVIQEWMLALGLKGSELTAYALIYGFCQDDESDFHGSTAYVAHWCGISRQQAVAVLRKLTEAGHVIKTGESGFPAHYRTSFSEGGVNFPPPYKNLTGGVKLFDKGCQETGHDNKEDNKKDNKNTHTLSERAREEKTFGDKVRMTADEYSQLERRFGAADARRLCEILDDYLVIHPGKKYASHYRAILSWCVNKLNDEKLTAQRLANAAQAGQRITNVQHPVAPGSGATLRAATDRLRELIENDPKLKQQNGLL